MDGDSDSDRDRDCDCDGDGGGLELEVIKYKQCFRPYHERKASAFCEDFLKTNFMDLESDDDHCIWIVWGKGFMDQGLLTATF